MNYQLTDVRKRLDQALQQEIIDFWLAQGALSPQEATHRVGQVFHIARDPAGELVGLCTIYVQWIDSLKLPMFYYRSLTRGQNRSGGLARQLLTRSYQLLNQEYAHSHGSATQAPVGMLLDVENPQLKAKPEAVWKAGGDFVFVGLGPKGNHIHIAYFDGATLT